MAEPGDIAEGTTRYLAAQGIEQVEYFDEIAARMPTPEEARLLEIGAGVPVMLWTRTGYSADRPIRCTITTFRGDLNRMNYEIGNLAARSETRDHHACGAARRRQAADLPGVGRSLASRYRLRPVESPVPG